MRKQQMSKNSSAAIFGFTLFAVLTLSCVPSFAQKAPVDRTDRAAPAPPKDESAQETQIYSRVLNILSETADEAKGWDDPKIAAQVLARIADIVWDIDPLSAESYLIRAWEKTKDVKESSEKASEFRNASPRVDSSAEVLRVARKRSPELAKKWLDQLTDLAEQDFKKSNNGVFDDRTARSAILLQLALQSASDNPQAAAAYATESLRDGISFGLQMVLPAIQDKDPELAQTVFRSALKRIQKGGIQSPDEISILYSYVYTPGQVIAPGRSANSGQFTVGVTQNRPLIVPLAKLNPPLALEFLRISTAALLGLPYPPNEVAAREQTSVLNTILYKTADVLPQESQAVRERLTSIMASTNYDPAPAAPEGTVRREAGEKVEDYLARMFDKLVDQAEKETNPIRRDILLAQIALKADAQMFERAKSIAGNIQDKEIREQVTNLVLYRKTLKEIELDNFDNAYKILAKNSNLKQRAASLIIGANKLKKGKDKVQLGYWLSDAEKLFGKAEKTDVDWVKIGCALTSAYSGFSRNDASDVFGKTAKLIDDETKIDIGDDNAPLASGFSGIEFISFVGDTKGFSLKSAVLTFSRDDFDDALSSLKAIKNSKARGFGIVALSEKYIADSKKYLREMEKKAAK